MAMAVIDASALLPVFIPSETSAAARQVFAEYDLIAPGLIVSECANALWKYVQSGDMPQGLAIRAYEAMFLHLNLMAETTLENLPLDLAIRFEHPAYDCFYLALANQRNVPLITGDKRMLRKFDGQGLLEMINIHSLH